MPVRYSPRADARRMILGTESEYSVTGFRDGRQLPNVEVCDLLLNLLRRLCLNLNQLRGNGFYTAQGFRFYAEINAHLEACTPEVDDPRKAAIYDQVGERLLLRAVALALSRHGVVAHVFRHNAGAVFPAAVSFGHHESYRCYAPPDEVAQALLPHLATRSFYAGAGCLREHPTHLFCLSQRALHIQCAVSHQTEGARPLCCQRVRRDMDEYLGPPHWYRSHQISADAHRLPFAEFLTLACTALLYDMLNHGFPLPLAPRLITPVSAFQLAVMDPTGRVRLPLSNGETTSPLEIQSAYCAAAEDYLHTADAPQWAAAAVQHWRTTLDQLAADPRGLADRLDAYHKYYFIERQFERQGYTWEQARQAWNLLSELRRRIREDILLAFLTDDASTLDRETRPARELAAKLVRDHGRVTLDQLTFLVRLQAQLLRFHRLGDWCDDLLRDGLLDPVILTEEDVAEGLAAPPQGTRACARGRHIERLQAERREWRASWDRLSHHTGRRWVDLSDPLDTVGQEHTLPDITVNPDIPF